MLSVKSLSTYHCAAVCIVSVFLISLVYIRLSDVTVEHVGPSRDLATNWEFPAGDNNLPTVPTNISVTSIIPRIIHQTWDTHQVPRDLVPWIKSWMVHNPGWTYWFWTPDDVRFLLKHKYPTYLKLYNSYYYNIFRSDIMRYFIMESFGGFYVDLDMDCLRPLDQWIYNYSCLLSLEPHEHPYFGFGRSESNVMNTILASRPRHPFWLKVIESLKSAYEKHRNDVQKSTGPLFLDTVLKAVSKDQPGSVTNMTSFRQLSSKSVKENSITVLPPKYFLPTYDEILKEKVSKGCKTLKTTDQDLIDVCERTKGNGTNTPGREAFTNHHWVHMFLAEKKWKNKETESIFNIIPKVKVYNDDER